MSGTPLHRAAERGDLDKVNELVRGRADVGARGNDGYTPLHRAAERGDLNRVKELVRSGADLGARNNDGYTPLCLAVGSGYLDIVKELVRSGADVGARNNDGYTPLHPAASRGYPDIVKELVRARADVGARNNNGDTPFHYAAYWGYLDIVKELIRSGADVGARNNNGDTPLHYAARSGELDIVKELVRSGADVGARTNHGSTPLMWAVIKDYREISEFLLQRMTARDLSAVDDDGLDLLHYMAENDRPWSQVIKDITDRCPDLLSRTDRCGHRPIDTARRRGQGVYGIFVQMEHRQQQQQQQQYTAGISGNVENPCNITITVVGHNGVGKSCFVRQLKKEPIPEGGPCSTDTADFYINYIGYNPNTGFRQNLDKDGEIETGRQRLKRIIDRFRKGDRSAVRPSDDRPTPYHDNEEAATNSPDLHDEGEAVAKGQYGDKNDLSATKSNLHDNKEGVSTSTTDVQTTTSDVPTVEVPVLSANKKKGFKQKLKRFFCLSPFRRQRRDARQDQQHPKQDNENPTTSEENELKNIPLGQKSVIKEVMQTKTDGDGDEEVKGYVTIYDFGGEKVFYNTHHCFMSSNMVFVLVFDVAMCLDPGRQKDGYERIEFWLRSIATYAIDRAAHGKGSPPIILVGSHLDLLSQNKEQQQQLFASVLEKLYEKPELREIMETHVQEMYPMADLNDSTKNQAMYQQMWEKIIEVAPLQSQWMKPVPARWVALEHELVRLKNEDRVILTYAGLLYVNKRLAVPLEEDDIMEFLWKLKFFGSFLCFDLYGKRPFIVLQAQWIINAFKAIITDPKFLTELTTKQQLDWKEYDKSGVLQVEFIRQLWGRYQEFRFVEREETLCIALETLGLLSKPLSVDEEVNYFIVPSILQTADPEIIRPILDDPDTVTTVTLCLKFDNPFIPQAVWDKMIAACIHRFQRLDEPGVDGTKLIQRGFVCLSADCLWNMVINCCNNCMKVTMFKKDTDHSVPAGTGINLLNILEFLLRRILELNHQSHLRYQFYLHNDYRFTPDEKMAKVDDLRQTPRLQCYSANGTRWVERDDLYIWLKNPAKKSEPIHMHPVDLTKELPGRKMSSKEISRVSKYIGSTYQTFFAELDCPVEVVEQEMEDNRHLVFRSKMTKILLHFQRMKPDTGFLTIADAMSRHGMDSTKLRKIVDYNRDMLFKDDNLPDEWLQKNLSCEDVPIIVEHIHIKSYFNLFLELGFTPNSVDEFDDHYRNRRTREKITALFEAFIKETDPHPTVNTILLAMQECDMDTDSLTSALKPT